MVISLDMEAGGIGTMPSFCHRTWPVWASMIRPMFSAGFDRGLRWNSEGANRRKKQEKAAEHDISELLVHDDMGVVCARAGDAGERRIGIRDRGDRRTAYSIKGCPPR